MGDIYQLNFQNRIDDKVCSFALHYEQTGGSTGAAGARQAAHSANNQIVPLLLDILATDVSFQGVSAKRVYPLPGYTARIGSDDSPGTFSGTSLPAICCLVLNLRNSAGNLPRPGRLFISGVSKGAVDNGQWLAAFLTTEVTAFAAGLKELNAGGDGDFEGNLIVMRRYEMIDNPDPPPLRILSKLVPPLAIPVTDIDFAIEPGRQILRKSKMFGQ